MKRASKCFFALLLAISCLALVVHLDKNRPKTISPEGAEVIQAFIDQHHRPTTMPSPLRVNPQALPLLFDLAPFPELDPAFKSAAKIAQRSWLPAETIPVLRLDNGSLRGVTFIDVPKWNNLVERRQVESKWPGDYYTFDQPIIIGSQALLPYSFDQRKDRSENHQVLLVRNTEGWKIKADRVKLFGRSAEQDSRQDAIVGALTRQKNR